MGRPRGAAPFAVGVTVKTHSRPPTMTLTSARTSSAKFFTQVAISSCRPRTARHESSTGRTLTAARSMLARESR